LIHLDETGVYRVNSNCYPVDKMKHVPWFIASPAQEYFFKQHNLFYKSVPSYLEACQNELNYRQLDIIYPREGFKVYIPVGESGKQKSCIFKATHKNISATLFWHLDGNYMGSTQKFHQLSILPSVGKHVLVITDNEGETSTVKFEVIGK